MCLFDLNKSNERKSLLALLASAIDEPAAAQERNTLRFLESLKNSIEIETRTGEWSFINTTPHTFINKTATAEILRFKALEDAKY